MAVPCYAPADLHCTCEYYTTEADQLLIHVCSDTDFKSFPKQSPQMRLPTGGCPCYCERCCKQSIGCWELKVLGSFASVCAGGAALILSFHPDGMRGGHHFAADFPFPLAAAWDFDCSGFSACKSLSGNGGITVGLISSTPDDTQPLFP